MKVNNVCLNCGKIFTSNETRLYCEECNKERKKPKSKIELDHTIADVVKYAKENNISYGYAVAKMEGRIK